MSDQLSNPLRASESLDGPQNPRLNGLYSAKSVISRLQQLPQPFKVIRSKSNGIFVDLQSQFTSIKNQTYSESFLSPMPWKCPAKMPKPTRQRPAPWTEADSVNMLFAHNSAHQSWHTTTVLIVNYLITSTLTSLLSNLLWQPLPRNSAIYSALSHIKPVCLKFTFLHFHSYLKNWFTWVAPFYILLLDFIRQSQDIQKDIHKNTSL